MDVTAERTRRSLRRLGAVAGIAALAGCNDSSADPGYSGGTSESDSTDVTAAPSGNQNSDSTRTDEPGTVSDAECNGRIDELNAMLAATNESIERQTAELTELDPYVGWLEAKTEFLDRSFSDETISTARRVGNDVRNSTIVLKIGSSGTATGWFIDDDLIATNAHNVAGASDIVGYSIEGDRFDCSVVDYVERMNPDVAILRTDFDGVALPTGSVDSLSDDQPLIHVGNPGSVGNWIISLGRYKSTYEMLGPERTFTNVQTTVPGRKGNSGSPMVTLDGLVVGMTWGGGPVVEYPPDVHPQPEPPAVYDRMLPELSYSDHVAIDIVEELVEAWT